jgi:phosphomannomutase/phosphoglucomutase
MLDLIREGKKVIFGGEGNGGLIYPMHQFCRDGGMTTAMMVAVLKSLEMPLSELVKKLPENCMIKGKIRSGKSDMILSHIEKKYSEMHLDRTDGVKILDPSVWALIRPSGTEPLVRIIVESENQETAERFYQDLIDSIAPFCD